MSRKRSSCQKQISSHRDGTGSHQIFPCSAHLSPSFQKHQPQLSHLLQFSSTASTNVIVELQVVLDIPPLSSHPLLYTSNPAHSKLQHNRSVPSQVYASPTFHDRIAHQRDQQDRLDLPRLTQLHIRGESAIIQIWHRH